MKALTVTTGEVTGRTLVADVKTSVIIGRRKGRSRLASVVTTTSIRSSSRKSVFRSRGDVEVSGLILCERLFVVCFVGILLLVWAMVKCFLCFVFFVQMVSKHGLRCKHIK